MATQPQARARTANPRTAVAAVILFAVILGALNLASVWERPMFTGDAAVRMDNAHNSIVRLGNRFWLPYLQWHIRVFYRLRMPIETYPAIPVFYFTASMAMLGLIALRAVRQDRSRLAFALLLVTCFSFQSPLNSMGKNLYQELPGTAFLYALILVGAFGVTPGRLAAPLAAIGMLVRESLWIGLFAWTLVRLRTLWSNFRFALGLVAVWMVPLMWLGAIALKLAQGGRKVQPDPGGFPLINTTGTPFLSLVPRTLDSLWTALVRSNAIWLAAGLVASWIIFRSAGAAPVTESDEETGFLASFPRFSLLTLGITYALLIMLDPWEMTFGSRRQIIPLVEHAYIWAILAFSCAARLPVRRKLAVRAVIAASLLISARPDNHAVWKQGMPDLVACHARIRTAIREQDTAQPQVCIADSYFEGMARFVAPALHVPRLMLDPAAPVPASCAILIRKQPAEAAAGFDPVCEYVDGVARYSVSQRRLNR